MALPEGWGGFSFLLSLKVGWPRPMGSREQPGPFQWGEGAAPGIRRQGFSRHLPLCFPVGSECTTSCLDHNSESIVLPVNVTVRDIPHWLNPTRVQVSDWEENDLVDRLHALVLR